MNASPACALRENVLHETAQRPGAARLRGACPMSPQRAVARTHEAIGRGAERPSTAPCRTERPNAAGR
jgi:hypothetical protein